MKRENVRKLIKSIREGIFNWGDPRNCVEGHVARITKSYANLTNIAKFLGIEFNHAANLFVGKDENGDRIEGINRDIFEIRDGLNNPAHKAAVLKYLRQFRG